MASAERRRFKSDFFLLFSLLHLLLILLLVPGFEARHHHPRLHRQNRQHDPSTHRPNHRRHRPQLIEPHLSCHANMTATVTSGSYAKVLVIEADPRDAKCRSQRVGASINFDLKTDCGVQASSGNVFNFTIIARRFPGIAVDADRKIPMKCTFHLTGAAIGGWNVDDNPNIDTVANGGIIHERDEDIVLVDPDNADPDNVDPDNADPTVEDLKAIREANTGNYNVKIQRDSNSIEALHSKMLASERRSVEERLEAERLLTEDVLPDGRIVFRPEKFWYLAPLLAAVVFVSIFILVVYVRQQERSRKLLRLNSEKRSLATARTPTLEDIRAIVASDEKVDARQSVTSSGEDPMQLADPGQVTPDFDIK